MFPFLTPLETQKTLKGRSQTPEAAVERIHSDEEELMTRKHRSRFHCESGEIRVAAAEDTGHINTDHTHAKKVRAMRHL